MIAPALLLAVALNQHVTWTAGVRTEVRARTAVDGDSNKTAVGDLGLAADGALGVEWAGWQLGLGYDPVFRLREPYTGWHFDHTQRFTGALEFRREGRPRPFVRYNFSWGILDLSTLAKETGQPVPQTPLAGVGVLKVVSSDTAFGVEWPLSRLLALTTEGGYFWGGGSDFASALTLPLQSSPRGAARLRWQASPVDLFQFSLEGRHAQFGLFQYATPTVPAGFVTQQVATGTLQAGWTKSLAVHTSFDLSAGGALAWGQTHVGGVTSSTLQPLGLAAAGFSHQLLWREHTVDLSAQVGLGPFIDPYVGTAYERVDGAVSVGYAGYQHLSLWARLGASKSLAGGAYDIASGYGDVGGGWVGAPWWRVDLTGRLAQFHQGAGVATAGPAGGAGGAAGGAVEQFTWVVSLALTLTQHSE